MKKLIFGLVFMLVLVFMFSIFNSARAEENQSTPSTEVSVEKVLLPDAGIYLWVKTKEFVRLNILTYQDGSKAKVLESFTQTRIKEMNYADYIKNANALDKSLNRYQSQKVKALDYAQKTNDENIIDGIKKNTIEQQKEMTKIQINIENDSDLQKNIVEVQKNVANEVKNTVEITQGEDKATEIEQKINYVWVDPNADANGNLPKLPDKWEYVPGTEGRNSAGKLVKVKTDQGEVEIYQESSESSQLEIKGGNSSSDSNASTPVDSNGNPVIINTENDSVKVETAN